MNNNKNRTISIKISDQLNRVQKTLDLLKRIFPVCIPSQPIRDRENDGVHVFVVAATRESGGYTLLSQAEIHEIIAELKALIVEALRILNDKEDPLGNDIIRARTNEQDRA